MNELLMENTETKEIPTESPVLPAAAPVAEAQRLKLIDALRGVALLGILLMNIPGFAMPNYFSESFRSDPTNINFWVSAVISVVFEGKMRAHISQTHCPILSTGR